MDVLLKITVQLWGGIVFAVLIVVSWLGDKVMRYPSLRYFGSHSVQPFLTGADHRLLLDHLSFPVLQRMGIGISVFEPLYELLNQRAPGTAGTMWSRIQQRQWTLTPLLGVTLLGVQMPKTTLSNAFTLGLLFRKYPFKI